MNLKHKSRIWILVMGILTIFCQSEQPKTMSQIQRELYDERCGLRICSESEKDGYYRYADFPEYYFKQKELPRKYRYRIHIYYSKYPVPPYGYRTPPYGR